MPCSPVLPDYIVLTNKLHGAEHYSRDPQLFGHSIVPQHFMEPEGSLPHSQELTTCPYPEPDQSSPHHPILTNYMELSTTREIPSCLDTR
jgi:hypothetical protein